MADELEKMQRALNQSYADRDRMASDLDKVRDDLERSQVCKNKRLVQSKALRCTVFWGKKKIVQLKIRATFVT